MLRNDVVFRTGFSVKRSCRTQQRHCQEDEKLFDNKRKTMFTASSSPTKIVKISCKIGLTTMIMTFTFVTIQCLLFINQVECISKV